MKWEKLWCDIQLQSIIIGNKWKCAETGLLDKDPLWQNISLNFKLTAGLSVANGL